MLIICLHLKNSLLEYHMLPEAGEVEITATIGRQN
jgi:hypothetical protein